MKKILFTTVAIFAALSLFISCYPSTGVSSQNEEVQETSKETAQETSKDAPQEAPEETKTATPDTVTENPSEAVENEDTLKRPVLPASVGEDPFKGKSYHGGTGERYEFRTDGTFTYTFDHQKNFYKYDYTYNANTKILTQRFAAIPVEGEEPYTYEEAVEYFTGLKFPDDKDLFRDVLTEEDFKIKVQNALKQIKDWFEQEIINLAWFEGSELFLNPEPYTELPTLATAKFRLYSEGSYWWDKSDDGFGTINGSSTPIEVTKIDEEAKKITVLNINIECVYDYTMSLEENGQLTLVLKNFVIHNNGDVEDLVLKSSKPHVFTEITD